MMTGENTARASRAAPYGSHRRNQRLERWSHSMKASVTGTSKPMEYF